MRKATPIVVALVVAVSLLAACSHSSSDTTVGSTEKSAGKDSGKGAGKGGKKGRFAEDGPIPVTVTTAARRDVPIYLNGLGAVLAFNTATLRAQVSGKLVAVPFKEGDEVKAGEVLAKIDPRTYQATLDQALAKKAQDQATLHSAQLDLKRYQDLLPDGYVSGQQVDQQKALVISDQALLQSDDAAIESARVTLSYCTVTAPFTGVVGLRQVDVGNLVSASDQTGILVLTQIRPISVTFTLPEQSLAQVRAQGAQQFTVLAVSRDNQNELARGSLLAFDNQIDQTTGTIKLKASFPNEDKALWPGQFVNARLLLKLQKDAVTVPAQAVQLGPNGSFVYVVNESQAVEMKTVTPGPVEGGSIVISTGLNGGEKVVVDGQSRLQPDSKVSATEMAAPAQSEAAGANGTQPAAGTQPAGPDAQPPDSAVKQGRKHRKDQSGGSSPSSGGAQ
jgi:multidrug efflux system membrane fusion protein